MTKGMVGAKVGSILVATRSGSGARGIGSKSWPLHFPAVGFRCSCLDVRIKLANTGKCREWSLQEPKKHQLQLLTNYREVSEEAVMGVPMTFFSLFE